MSAALCNAKKKKGGKCGRPAGWGTPHFGRGPCKLHGGCAPGVVAKYARQAGLDFAVGMLGAEIKIEPIEAVLLSVRLAAGVVGYWRMQIAALEPEQTVPEYVATNYRWALKDLAQISRTALDAGVAEMQIRFAQRTAERIALAAEEALTRAQIPADMRSRFVEGFTRALQRLEDEPDDDEPPLRLAG